MKCYFAGSRSDLYGEHEFYDVVFANNAKEAKKLVWDFASELLSDACDCSFLNLRVIRQPQFDNQNAQEPYIEDDPKELRRFGWFCHGDDYCCKCGLYEYDGQFPVCDECDQCSECGHTDDCPLKEKVLLEGHDD